MRQDIEGALQRSIVEHLRLRGNPGAIWYHCPNNVPASKRTGARYKALGVVAGVPDLSFVLPDGTAAFMELKKPGGTLSPVQRAFMLKCINMGVPHSVVADIDTALDILEAWQIIRPEAEF